MRRKRVRESGILNHKLKNAKAVGKKKQSSSRGRVVHSYDAIDSHLHGHAHDGAGAHQVVRHVVAAVADERQRRALH
jgi:hypothetical protein